MIQLFLKTPWERMGKNGPYAYLPNSAKNSRAVPTDKRLPCAAVTCEGYRGECTHFTGQGRCSMWLLHTDRQKKQSKTQQIPKLQLLWAHPYILLFFQVITQKVHGRFMSVLKNLPLPAPQLYLKNIAVCGLQFY